MKKILIALVSFSMLFALSLPLIDIYAQGPIPPPPPPGGGTPVLINFPNPLNCNESSTEPPVLCVINKLLQAAFQISIPIVTLMVMIGAFQILFAAGNPEKLKSGRNTILYAVIGFAVLLLSFGITYIIQDLLTRDP